MKSLLFKLSAAFLTFAIGLAVSADWKVHHHSSGVAAGLLMPVATAQEAEPGTLLWLVQKAKAEGQTTVETASIGCGMGIPSLNFSLANYSLVVAQPVERRPYADTYNLVTWYKFKVTETLSSKPALGYVGRQLADIRIPAEMLPVKADEIVMMEGGGTLVIDGVKVTSHFNSPEFSLSENYLLFLALDADKRMAAVPWSDPTGIFKIQGDDVIAAVYDDGSYDLKNKLAARFGNSLTRLREFCARRASQKTAARRNLPD